MAIEIIEGYIGAGKTTFAVKQALVHARRKKWRVVCNFPVNHPDVEFGNWEDIKQARECIAVIDEASRWFSSRNWSKTTEEELEPFKHTRKFHRHIYLIVQDVDQLDVELRDRVAQYIWRVKRLFGPDEYDEPTPLERRIGCWSLCSKYHAHNYNKAKQMRLSTERIRLNDYFGLFDTAHLVGRRDDRHSIPPAQAAGAQAEPAALIDVGKLERGTVPLDWCGLTLWRPPLDDAIEDMRRVTPAPVQEPTEAPMEAGRRWRRGQS